MVFPELPIPRKVCTGTTTGSEKTVHYGWNGGPVHEENWKAALKGIPISYGANPITDIGTTLGIAKKHKRGHEKVINNGRPPDTTDKLVDGKKKKKFKLGRPPKATNFNKSLWSAYPSYQTNKDNTA
ncbi:uncharacterized protein PGTG_12577 [Puccinia graminis f. sp. tritici CRL 75-36-700-3]|uniref:Uncharacterized protein n=1 Tax=Puccinia graminis f. sp. tritici (strain CRL 75-36-700-3 / race SCCL) TaxID=418459 RepID=E3KV30_PUCGT|nr:uncharacterized protein PGTG_12577 [Puccinia graminis f. sp. tritici CRL 75-36-700-3]EFP88130.2 hypothetical protein PGTG_12577 [Puccinia graminis f. sp. tritici CRL 75-36-700-3]